MEEMGSAYYKAYIALEKINRYAELIDNPYCVKEVVNKDYWDADTYLKLEEDPEDPLKYYILIATAGAVLLIALALFTLWYCKKKGNSDAPMLANESTRNAYDDD